MIIRRLREYLKRTTQSYPLFGWDPGFNLDKIGRSRGDSYQTEVVRLPILSIPFFFTQSCESQTEGGPIGDRLRQRRFVGRPG